MGSHLAFLMIYSLLLPVKLSAPGYPREVASVIPTAARPTPQDDGELCRLLSCTLLLSSCHSIFQQASMVALLCPFPHHTPDLSLSFPLLLLFPNCDFQGAGSCGDSVAKSSPQDGRVGRLPALLCHHGSQELPRVTFFSSLSQTAFHSNSELVSGSLFVRK